MKVNELLRKHLVSILKEQGDPCWANYKQIGMKDKGGKQVPNCVPKNESVDEDDEILEEIEEDEIK